jgi:hypothetical protein
MTATQVSTSKPSRWYAVTPSKLLALFLIIELALYLSDRFDWFAFNRHKGWTVLFAAGVAIVATILFPTLGLIGCCFGAKPRFGLSTAMAFVFVVALPFCWLRREIAVAHEQDAVRQLIRDEQGDERSSQFDGMRVLAPQLFRPGVPPAEVKATIARVDFQCLRSVVSSVHRHFGEDFFCEVLEVRLRGDVGLERLAALDRLQILNFERHTFSDAEMRQFQTFKELQQLFIERCQLPEGGLANIAPLKRLELLRLTRSQVTDADVSDLQGLSSLKTLFLDGNPISDAGLAELVHLSQLEFLSLDETHVTDAGLRHLLQFKKLRRLSLYRTKVTEETFEQLAEALPECRITN